MIPILNVGLVDAIRGGRVHVVAALGRSEDGAVVLADCGRLEVDAVIAATGYRPALEPLVASASSTSAESHSPIVRRSTHGRRAPFRRL